MMLLDGGDMVDELCVAIKLASHIALRRPFASTSGRMPDAMVGYDAMRG